MTMNMEGCNTYNYKGGIHYVNMLKVHRRTITQIQFTWYNR